MHSSKVLIAVGSLGLFVFACSQDPGESLITSVPTDSTPAGERMNAGPSMPDAYYALEWETFAYSGYEYINTHKGTATHLFSLDLENVSTDEYFGWSPLGLVFDLDGTPYVTQNIASFDPGLVRSQLARIDPETGAVFPIGEPVPFNTSGLEIDACGNLYVTGFQVEALGYFWGNSMLWKVDKVTGEFTPVGDTGHTHWMDIAFDDCGTLWGTFDNRLYVIDTETGASTLMTEIHGVPDAGPPRYQEVMSIAFDKHGRLWGMPMTVYYDDPNGQMVLSIDPMTGNAEFVGYTGRYYAHGGDIRPHTVRIAHRTADGEYRCETVSMSSLPAHLAHGDWVPGTAGFGCDCP